MMMCGLCRRERDVAVRAGGSVALCETCATRLAGRVLSTTDEELVTWFEVKGTAADKPRRERLDQNVATHLRMLTELAQLLFKMALPDDALAAAAQVLVEREGSGDWKSATRVMLKLLREDKTRDIAQALYAS